MADNDGTHKNDGLHRYVEAGAALSRITRARFEQTIRELLEGFEPGRDQMSIDDVVERGRKATEAFVDMVHTEVSDQLEGMGLPSVEDLATRVADLLRRSTEVGRDATTSVGGTVHDVAHTVVGSAEKVGRSARTTARKATKKTTPKKAPAKKTTAKKAPAKKATAKKATAKKAPAKTMPAKKTTAKKTTAKKAPAKRTSATKATAKRATRSPSGT
ncbi:MAG TPA: hypothetical protein VKG43_01925 [Acidimicrobiales bacterium]|nr:hypothetical protein [Acidimicrobiales bacterium]